MMLMMKEKLNYKWRRIYKKKEENMKIKKTERNEEMINRVNDNKKRRKNRMNLRNEKEGS